MIETVIFLVLLALGVVLWLRAPGPERTDLDPKHGSDEPYDWAKARDFLVPHSYFGESDGQRCQLWMTTRKQCGRPRGEHR